MPKLFPYQEEGARFLAANPRCGLFDEPGLGKTAQTVHAWDILGLERGLVVCPASVRSVWPGEIRKFSAEPRRVIKGLTNDDLNLWLRGKADILVTSYEKATHWRREFERDIRDFTVWDEAHLLKNAYSQRTRAAYGHNCAGEYGYGKWSAYAWVATGTPMANDPMDTWTWLRFVGGTRLTLSAFATRYFVERAGLYNKTYTPRKDTLPELKAIIREFSLRRTLEQAGVDLPPLWITTQTIEGNTGDINSLLAQHPGLDKSIIDAIDKGGLGFLDASHVTTLRRLVGEAKAPVFGHQLVEELQGGLDKIVVFCAHRKPIEVLTEILRKAEIGHVVIDGRVDEAGRAAAVEKFQTDPDCRVFIGNIVAAGTGLTLTAASQLVMLESDWQPANNAQALKRVHRLGQSAHVHVRFISLAKSIDEQVSETVARKSAAIAQVQED